MRWGKEEREERAKRQAEADESVRRIRNVQKRLADKDRTNGLTVFTETGSKKQDPEPSTFVGCLRALVLIILLYTALAACSAVFYVLMGSR